MTTAYIESVWSDEYRKNACIRIWGDVVNAARSSKDVKVRELFEEDDVPVTYNNVDHQIIGWLEEAANLLKCPNLHVGMTSSDVEENARLMQILVSVEYIVGEVRKVQERLATFQSMWEGRTHLQPASLTGDRHIMWITCLTVDLPVIRPKAMGGITGNFFETPECIKDMLDDMNWSRLGFKERQDIPRRQGTGCKSELNYAHFLSALAAGVVKICTDFRILCMTGEMTSVNQTASSSDPMKFNPTKLEKAESIATTIPAVYNSVWQAMAHDALEGTLNRRWSLDHELSHKTIRMVKCLHTLFDGIGETRCSINKTRKPEEFASFKLTREVEQGTRRDTAYNQFYSLRQD